MYLAVPETAIVLNFQIFYIKNILPEILLAKSLLSLQLNHHLITKTEEKECSKKTCIC